MKTKIERTLEEEADFGDLVELVLKEDTHFAGRREDDGLVVLACDKSDETKYDCFGIKYVCGYFGGIKEYNYSENPILDCSSGKVRQIAVYTEGSEKEPVICINPMVHRRDAIRELHFNGEGYVKVPISAVAAYTVLSKNRRGLRVVN